MPIRLRSKLPSRSVEARIEIVPLIDIMFFLLAAFILVSLSMVHAMSIKVDLPAAATASPDSMKDVVTISIDRDGKAYLNKKPMAENELRRALAAEAKRRVVISGDRDARHGNVIHILDLIRSAGIEKVSFDITMDKGK